MLYETHVVSHRNLDVKSSFAKIDKRHSKTELFTPPCGLHYLDKRHLLQGGVFSSTPRWCLLVFANELFMCRLDEWMCIPFLLTWCVLSKTSPCFEVYLYLHWVAALHLLHRVTWIVVSCVDMNQKVFFFFFFFKKLTSICTATYPNASLNSPLV